MHIRCRWIRRRTYAEGSVTQSDFEFHGERPMTEVQTVSPARSEPVLPPIFPTFGRIRIQMPIVSGEMTIWPSPSESRWQWVKGYPYELHPFAWDMLWIRCDGYRVQIEPHYAKSTWDTFWTDGNGYVKADALRGLFPFTLGKEVNLLKGIVATLEALPPLIADRNPDDATKIQQIHGILKTREAHAATGPDPSEGLTSLRRSASEKIWRRKVRRLGLEAGDGTSRRA
jgi:hypothetical protein